MFVILLGKLFAIVLQIIIDDPKSICKFRKKVEQKYDRCLKQRDPLRPSALRVGSYQGSSRSAPFYREQREVAGGRMGTGREEEDKVGY